MKFFGGIALVLCLGLTALPTAWAQFASTVIGYDRAGCDNDYDDANAVLGSPDRLTAGWPSGTDYVTVFNPSWGADTNAWGSDQVFSFAPGGYITVRFDSPVVDDALNPFGLDLIVFGNAGLISADWPPTTCTDPAMLLGDGHGLIELSQDGSTWFSASALADALFPTTGWTDAAHTAPSDFLRPVDPTLALAAFDGLTEAEVLALYGGSGGGVGIDLAPTGLGWIQYVRVTNTNAEGFVDIDAFADVAAGAGPVPEPGLLLAGAAALAVALRRRRK
ncbi:MAG: hypothetical protein JW889_14955 [Verrucomicrobia bacterium]|nr:hypothetical protein [Verrucomicrobiota bacterium]